MLRPGGPPGAELGSDNKRHRRATPGHEVELRRLVHDLVEAHTDEVQIHDLYDRLHSGHGRADGQPDDGALRDRRVEDTSSKLGVQATGQSEDVAAFADVDAGEHHSRILAQCMLEGIVNCVHHLELWLLFRRRIRSVWGAFGYR